MPKKKRHRKRPILVPLDFSPSSEEVLCWAADAAERYQAPLLILHVVHDLAAAPGYYNNRKRGFFRRLEEAAAEMMQEFLDRLQDKYPTLAALQQAQTMLVVGLPVNRILEVAKKTRARQIVIGSQGRTGLPHFLLGSKAERVAQLAPIPVTIVKGVSLEE